MIKDTDIHIDYVRVMVEEVNIPSDFFPAESYLIDNIFTCVPCFATLEHAPWYQLIYSQVDTRIRLSAIDASLD